MLHHVAFVHVLLKRKLTPIPIGVYPPASCSNTDVSQRKTKLLASIVFSRNVHNSHMNSHPPVRYNHQRVYLIKTWTQRKWDWN
ncbi:hypothetical protein M569_17689 [Genlisea aurea]|uniref:Uncharacterized protein n=1 Tax=Genlisea aurea TaxID=192259 RepID=S8D375_9LAMI|nr:hypothetical protein M569_17689 [Genlisea aurea]